LKILILRKLNLFFIRLFRINYKTKITIEIQVKNKLIQVNISKHSYLISLIFCPPLPIMQPIKSLGIFISCVCILCMPLWFERATGGGGGGATAPPALG
jgi:hypothetical protein